MTPEELRHAAKVLLAAADGKPIQYYSNDCCWLVYTDTDFNFNRWKFRIKPEPRETWDNFFPDNSSFSFNTKIEAIASAERCGFTNPEEIAIHMREVMDE